MPETENGSYQLKVKGIEANCSSVGFVDTKKNHKKEKFNHHFTQR